MKRGTYRAIPTSGGIAGLVDYDKDFLYFLFFDKLQKVISKNNGCP